METALQRFSVLQEVAPPARGWIRAIRDALGMSGAQLAKRLKTNRKRVSRIEQDAEDGRAIIRAIQDVAEAPGSNFVCGFVPRQGVEETVRQQAAAVAE